MIGLDTNALLRLYFVDHAEQSKIIAGAVSKVIESGRKLYINNIVLVESVWVLESSLRKSRSEIAGFLERIIFSHEFVIQSADCAKDALAAYRDLGVDFSDALIGLVNQSYGCSATYTFDRKAARLAQFQCLS